MNLRYMFVFAVVLFCCLSTSAQNIDQMPTISVTGSSEVRVVPDEAIFNLTVSKLNKDLQLAQKQNDDTVAQIINLCKAAGIPAQNVKTDFYEYQEKYTWVGKDEKVRLFLGYQVSKEVKIRLSDMSKFEGFFRDLIKTGVSSVGDVDLQTTQIRKYRDQARAMAMKAAREKAAALAGEIGQTIGKAVWIREGAFRSNFSISGASANSSNYVANSSGDGESFSASYSTAENSTFSPGTISVKAEVTVSFLLN